MENLASDEYLSIRAASEGLYKDRGSRFIALAAPVETEEQARQLFEKARKDYHDARHHCLAYRLGLGGRLFRASDDGEPAGSAGRPILGQIDCEALSDVAVVVVRYFGGIKLGVPGLISAYRGATADALSKAEKVVKISGVWVKAEFPYEAMPQVMKLVKDMDLPSRDRRFDILCSMELRIRDSLRKEFFDGIENIANFQYKFI